MPILTRRSFVAGAAMVPGLALAHPLPPARAGAEWLLVDAGLADAEALAAAWQPILRATPILFRGDVALAWSAHLHGRWNDRGPRIAGLTSGNALFCMKILARAHRHRVEMVEVFGTNGLHRWLIGPGRRDV
jgi:hypothetical protein